MVIGNTDHKRAADSFSAGEDKQGLRNGKHGMVRAFVQHMSEQINTLGLDHDL